MPNVGIGRRHPRLPFFCGMGPLIAGAHADTSGVKPKTDAQRLEGAFLSAPEDSQEQRSLLRRCVPNECLLGGCKVIGDERVAAGFNLLQIAAEVGSAGTDSA